MCSMEAILEDAARLVKKIKDDFSLFSEPARDYLAEFMRNWLRPRIDDRFGPN